MIEGLDSLEAKLEHLSSLPEAKKFLNRAMSVVQGAAKANATVRRVGNGGALRRSIHTDIEMHPDRITGICYTNLEYASYVEFGTGPAGQAEHSGISPNVSVQYRQSGWVIPADAMSEGDAREYGFRVVYGKDGQIIGYSTRGQAAQPFLYPALADNRAAVVNELKKAINAVQRSLEND